MKGRPHGDPKCKCRPCVMHDACKKQLERTRNIIHIRINEMLVAPHEDPKCPCKACRDVWGDP